MNSIFDQRLYQKSRYSIKNFRSNFHFLDRIRIIHLFRELFRIISILLTTRSFFSIYSIALIIQSELQSENCTKKTVISNQKILISRNISSIFDIETISLFWKSIRKYIHRFINSMSFFYFDDRLDIQSKSQHHWRRSIFTLFQYRDHLSFSKTLSKHICLLRWSIIFFDFNDNFNIDFKNRSIYHQHLTLQSFFSFENSSIFYLSI